MTKIINLKFILRIKANFNLKTAIFDPFRVEIDLIGVEMNRTKIYFY